MALTCTTDSVLLTGPNGAGKTNLLEALSFLSPGRGLRQTKLGDLQKYGTQAEGPWAVSIVLENEDTFQRVGTAGAKSPLGGDTRRVFLNGNEGVPQARLTEVINVLWLTPSMDRLFLEGTTARRKFLDRLVYGFDAQHASRINRFEAHMRERNRLLADNMAHHPWLMALEKQMSDEAFSILLARERTVSQIQHSCEKGLGPFPSPYLTLKGALEDTFSDLHDHEAFTESYRAHLEKGRTRDQAAGRTLIGPHATDFDVFYKEKNMPAHQCSTGEQKALLIGIILAAARLKSEEEGAITLILLDEIVAHLDKERRQALLKEILSLPLQAWMTGTDAEFFRDFYSQIQHFQVEKGTLKQV